MKIRATQGRTARGLVLAAAVALAAAAPSARAASLTQVSSFGSNPTNLAMYLYVPDNLPSGSVGLLLALHYCTGTGPAFYSGSDFKSLADQYKFIVIYPSATRSGQCWDVYSSQGLARNGGSDNNGLLSMISYVKGRYNIDANRVFVTGASSGAMMTNVMIAEYPDVFKAGSAFMGVPYTCFATSAGSTWNSQCANGQVSKTAQQWGDAVRNAYPGFTGARPRMQLFHGTTDSTLNYNNFGEEVKQWTNVLGVSQTATQTSSIANNCTRSRYGGTSTQAPVEGVSCAGVGHNLPLSGQAALAIAFMGLDSPPTTGFSISVTRAGQGTGTVTSSSGGINCGTTCQASYTSGATVTLTASATAPSTFAGWGGACTGSSSTCVLSMTTDRAVTATFDPGPGTSYPLTVTTTGSGAVTSSTGGINCGTVCSASILSGTAVTLTASPAAGASFTGWSGACTGSSATCLVTMTAAASVTASFSGVTPTGTVSINAGGAAVGGFAADTGFSGGTTYTNTATIDTSLLAAPVPPASIFNSERYGNFTYTITGLTPSSAQTVTLYFAETYQTAAGRRSFGVSINGTSVLSGFDIYAAAGGANKAIARSFSAAASASGQVVIQFVNGTVDNAKVNGISVVAGDGPIPTTYALTVSTSGNGSVTGAGIDCGTACSATLDAGTVVTLTASPGANATFSGWSGACSGTSPTCVVTMSAAQTVSAAFTDGGPTTPCASPITFTGNTSNFNSTGAVCYRTSGAVNGWGCANFAGRTVSVNGGTATSTCGAGPFPLPKSADGYTYFSVSAGTYPWASIYTW